MAALSISPIHSLRNNSSIQELGSRTCPCPRTFILMSCQRGDPVERSAPKPKKEKQQQLVKEVFGSFERIGKGLTESLSPKHNGDWKDVLLMSFSFAVYVYISQKIVCAYCAWMSLLKQQW